MELPKGIELGAQAPDVAFLKSDGGALRLSEAWQQGSVVLVWYHLAFTGG